MADVGNVIAPRNVAVVTAGAGGTGRAVAERLAVETAVTRRLRCAAMHTNPPTPIDDAGAGCADGRN